MMMMERRLSEEVVRESRLKVGGIRPCRSLGLPKSVAPARW